VSGLGGWDIRSQKRWADWWASVYTSTQGATHGALFCDFGSQFAECYFKATDGAVPDRFRLTTAPLEPAVTSQAASNVSTVSPPAPANLRVDVNSSSSFELFWDRPAVTGLRYEVRADGVWETNTDGVSWYFADSCARSVDVTTLDAEGRRSDRTTLLLEPHAADTASRVPAPGQLRSAVYSRSSLEVFWDRVPQARLRYEVRINGQWFEQTDGTSTYFQALQKGQSYEVDIVALDPSGRRSESRRITVNTLR